MIGTAKLSQFGVITNGNGISFNYATRSDYCILVWSPGQKTKQQLTGTPETITGKLTEEHGCSFEIVNQNTGSLINPE